jgi:rhodanese-related sulfurtransferase
MLYKCKTTIQGETEMLLTLAAICVGVACLLIVIWFQRARAQQEMEQHSITPEALHTLLAANTEVLLFDVRQPLDLLASDEIIPGAKRIPPRDVLENPSLIPREKDSVVYCTCPSDKSSRAVLHRALALHFLRVKFLKGGFEAWKAKGYPVEPYNELIHLDIAT